MPGEKQGPFSSSVSALAAVHQLDPGWIQCVTACSSSEAGGGNFPDLPPGYSCFLRAGGAMPSGLVCSKCNPSSLQPAPQAHPASTSAGTAWLGYFWISLQTFLQVSFLGYSFPSFPLLEKREIRAVAAKGWGSPGGTSQGAAGHSALGLKKFERQRP